MVPWYRTFRPDSSEVSMNRVQVNGLAAILGVAFQPARPHVRKKFCDNNHRDYHCDRKATEEAQIRGGEGEEVCIPTCSNAYCRISAAITAHAAATH